MTTISYEQLHEPKENKNQSTASIDFMPLIKLQNPFIELPQKINGPRLYYDQLRYDKSTSITEIREKLFEFDQIAIKAHRLSSLPVGPLASMYGYQMFNIENN